MVIVATNYTMKIFLSLLITVVVLSSCAKEEEYIIEYPTTFTSTKFSGQNIRVFTRYGEVKDSEISTNLFKRVKQYLTDLDTTQIENDISVTYHSETSVELISMSSSFNKMLNLYETPEITYWESRDTSVAVVGNSYYSFDFNKNHLKYHPLFEEHFIPPLP
ncbi:hypothetical protein [Flavisericum labens]|uniref:hypothetical protein n=1 Tax=Flavisericum labens TaxID=3377112 RepID=UPI00387AA274